MTSRSGAGSTTISIHALREEGDPIVFRLYLKLEVFLSTPSARRATIVCGVWPHIVSISIHALREEGDHYKHREIHGCTDFYPRPPRGGRPENPFGMCRRRDFYPRPPRGGRPSSGALPGPALKISIHALREEGDSPAITRPTSL